MAKPTIDPVQYLFSSLIVLRLLRFLNVHSDSFTAAELSKKLGAPSKEITKALKQLIKSGLVKSSNRKSSKAYKVDKNSTLYQPVYELIKFNFTAENKQLIKDFKSLGKVTLVAFSGSLVENSKSTVDVLIVGDQLDEKGLEKLLVIMGYKDGNDLSYMILDNNSFKSRYEMSDKVIRNFFDFNHFVLIGKI